MWELSQNEDKRDTCMVDGGTRACRSALHSNACVYDVHQGVWVWGLLFFNRDFEVPSC